MPTDATQLKYDGEVSIATATSRKATKLVNETTLLSKFADRTRTTLFTAETPAEYQKMSKDEQDERKDVGGFVGGFLANGKRLKGSVVHRSLLTLDLDFAETTVVDTYRMLFDNFAIFYSTHKHTPTKPRLRLVMPLSREVMADEYEPIGRYMADRLGIDQFDHTGYQAHRLMYWPSTSKGGQYVFELIDGPWLDVDTVLATYRDWRDVSSWPRSAGENEIIRSDIRKQGNPLEKPGPVGVYCRTYTIHEILEGPLKNVYSPCVEENRYTFTGGTTSGGMVVYEGKYAYSHHGTDPAGGKLCNSFDLVRLHIFGHMDETAAPGTPINKLPSYIAMVELAMKDPAVKKQLGSEKLAATMDDFDGVELEDDAELPSVLAMAGALNFEDSAADSTEWLAEMDVDGKGNYRNTTENIRLVLKNDPRLKGRLALNLFEHREIALRHLPWRKVTPETMHLTDKDDSGLRAFVEKHYGISHAGKLADALNMVLMEQSFHPVRDYLDRCAKEWDGLERINTLLVDYMGAEDSEYVQAVTRKMLVAAVARVYEPGCKFDYALVLVGPEGIGKSTLVRKLGHTWFTDNFNTVLGREAYEQIQGSWLVEMGELAGLKNAEVQHVKHFISKQTDKHRMAFGKRIEDFPRQCVFFGTTNEDDPLRESNGNRRFWIVPVGKTAPVRNVWDDVTAELVVQLWGEAVAAYRAGETRYLSAAMETHARTMQGEHTKQHPWEGVICEFLSKPIAPEWDAMSIYDRRSWLADEAEQGTSELRRDRVCSLEVWCEALGNDAARITDRDSRTINGILRNLPGWVYNQKLVRFKHYGPQRGYDRAVTDLAGGDKKCNRK